MTRDTPHVDVVVVGAGVSGLCAAAALTQSGRSVLCLEARNRVGGRALTAESAGDYVDLGATWFWSNEATVFNLLKQLGLGSFEQNTDGDALFERDFTGPVRLDGNPVDAPALRFSRGAQSLAHGLAETLPTGTLQLGDPVTAIDLTADRIVITAGSGRITATAVIVAVPPALVLETISINPPLPTELADVAAATPVWMGTTVKAVAVFEDAFWRAKGLSGSAISYAGPFREFHDISGQDGFPATLFAFASSAQFQGLAADDVKDIYRQQLVRLFGTKAVQPRELMVVDWSREQYSTPRQPSPYASTHLFGHPLYQEPFYHGRLHWASTETSPAFPGHIEGALQSGYRAGRAAERSVSQHSPCPLKNSGATRSAYNYSL